MLIMIERPESNDYLAVSEKLEVPGPWAEIHTLTGEAIAISVGDRFDDNVYCNIGLEVYAGTKFTLEVGNWDAAAIACLDENRPLHMDTISDELASWIVNTRERLEAESENQESPSHISALHRYEGQ